MGRHPQHGKEKQPKCKEKQPNCNVTSQSDSGRKPSEVSVTDVRSAIEGLYAEEAAPHESLLQWYLKSISGVTVSLSELREVVEAAPGISFGTLAGGKRPHLILLAKSPPWFKGFADTLQKEARAQISREVFREAAEFVLKGDWPQEDNIAHEKYGISRWLQGRSGALSALSFGKMHSLVSDLCHVKGVLGKKDGRIVPYPLSEEFEKQENAKRLMPTGLRAGENYVSTWRMLAKCMTTLLEENGGKIPSPRLKPMVRSRFQLELSETALGHMSLSSLMGDGRFTALFCVERSAVSAVEHIKAKEGADLEERRCLQGPPPAPERKSSGSADGGRTELPKLGPEPFKLPEWCRVRRTFIEATLSVPAAAAYRACSSPG